MLRRRRRVARGELRGAGREYASACARTAPSGAASACAQRRLARRGRQRLCSCARVCAGRAWGRPGWGARAGAAWRRAEQRAGESGRGEGGRREGEEKENGKRKGKMENEKKKGKREKRESERLAPALIAATTAGPVSHAQRSRARTDEATGKGGRGLEIGRFEQRKIPGTRVQGFRGFLSSTMKSF